MRWPTRRPMRRPAEQAAPIDGRQESDETADATVEETAARPVDEAADATIGGTGDKAAEETALRAVISEHAHAARSRLDPETGDMVRAVWFDAGRDRPGRLLLMIHHLAVDGVSWRILLPDLAAAWQDVVAGRPVEPAPVGLSFRRWSELLGERATDPVREDELPLWTSILSGGDPLPVARALDPERDVVATSRQLSLTLPADRTAPLLSRVPAAFGATVNDVLLTALALAVADWRRRAGMASPGNSVLVDLEGHGRQEELVGNVGPVAYGRLVHQRRPGPPGPGRRGPGGRVRPADPRSTRR